MRQGRIIDRWQFGDDWIRSPQDRCRYPSFRALCYFGAGLDTQQAALLFGVSADTIAAWGAADQAPPHIWRALLALAGEFEAADAAWKGWRLQKGKLYAPDMADGFTPGQIRSLPMLRGALDAYRRQAADPNRPDTSTVQEPKASPPMVATAGKREDKPPPSPELDGRSPLGRGQGLKRTPDPARSIRGTLPDQGTPTARRVEATRRIDQDPALTGSAPFLVGSLGRVSLGRRGSPHSRSRSAGDDRQGRGSVTHALEVIGQHQGNEAAQGQAQGLSVRRGAVEQVRRKPQSVGHKEALPVEGGDVTVTSERVFADHTPREIAAQTTHQRGAEKYHLLFYIDKPQEAGSWKKESPPQGMAALPLPLPARSGRKRPQEKPQTMRQGRIIDIMLNRKDMKRPHHDLSARHAHRASGLLVHAALRF